MTKKQYQNTFLFLLGIVFSLSMNAQEDVILKSNGDEMHGKVTKRTKDNLQFVQKNDALLAKAGPNNNNIEGYKITLTYLAKPTPIFKR